ncbi:MAG: DUF4919 domain-containing protein [candidate division NC10 bacterium]|nr:DUF4919 domain-containing protein [candidate division NC10 bacterium]
MARAKARDALLEFRAVRAAYAELPLEQRQGRLRAGKLQSEMLEALQRRDLDRALERAQTLLALCYVDIDAHVVASIVYRQHGDLDRANDHQWIANGLARSILDSGDGKSPETAFEVISVDEEYALFRVLGLRPTGQALMSQAGHSYDVMRMLNPRTQEAFTWHFNVDASLREIGEALRPGAK